MGAEAPTLLFYHEDGGTKLHRDTGNSQASYTAYNRQRKES